MMHEDTYRFGRDDNDRALPWEEAIRPNPKLVRIPRNTSAADVRRVGRAGQRPVAPG